MTDYIDSVLANQDTLSNFEVESLTRSIMSDRSITPAKGRAMIAKIQAKSNATVKYSGDTKQVSGDPEMSGGSMTKITGMAAKFSLRIVRNSNNTGVALPVVLFLSNFLGNEYRQILPNFLPAGVTLVSVVANTERVRFTFSNGGGTDTIDIFCTTAAYPSFLEDMNSMCFKTFILRMKTQSGTAANTDTDASSEFNTTLTPYRDTSFGEFGGNRYPLGDCEPPDQFRQNIIDIPIATWLTPRQGLVLPIAAPVAVGDAASFTVNLSFQVSKFNRSQVGQE